MNLKLYGICFKMRGDSDLLDYVQSKENIPVEIMEQVMNQMDSVTGEEIAFAKLLDSDWKKAFNERVPLLMRTRPDSGYDISCEIPNELLDTIELLTGKDPAKIVEEFTTDHLKNVCGIDADIMNVDMEDVKPDEEVSAVAPMRGFDITALTEGPGEPAFEDVSGFEIENVDEIPVPAVEAADQITEEVLEPEFDEQEQIEEVPEDYEPETPVYEGDDVPVEEGYPEDEGFPDADAEDEENYGDVPPYGYEEDDENIPDKDAADMAAPEADSGTEALKGIYKDLVGNIRDKKLDTRLGIKIGG